MLTSVVGSLTMYPFREGAASEIDVGDRASAIVSAGGGARMREAEGHIDFIAGATVAPARGLKNREIGFCKGTRANAYPSPAFRPTFL